MKNLEQIRAKNALAASESGRNFKGKEDGNSLTKQIPPLIINHGLLQTLAYTKSDAEGFKNILDFLAQHLSELGIVRDCDNVDSLIKALTDGDSVLLRQATSEALAWFNYARRFIK